LEKAHYISARNLHFLRGPWYLCIQFGLIEWLEGWDPDVLILEANPRYFSNLAAIRWMKRRNRPVVGWGLGAPPLGEPRYEVHRRMRQNFLLRFDWILAYSNLGASQYREAGAPAERVVVAYNAVTASPPPIPDRTPLEARPLRLLFVGRLQERKRIDLLLRACARLEEPPDLWIVGDGPAREGLERLADEIYPRTNFAGAQHGHALTWFFHHADLFVLPGTGGLAVQEAMAHGLPVIVSEGDGTQADLVAEGNGWLVPPGDVEALQFTIAEAMKDPEGLRQKGIVSHRMVSERFNIGTMVSEFVGVLNAAIGNR
jgi:glycosyltransferase involved in cell wall biosynthesis